MRLRTSGLSWNTVGDDVVVLDLAGSVYLKLNASAGFLWERLSRPCTEGELVAALIGRYGLSQDEAQTDVDEFVDELRRRDLIDD